MMKRHHLCMHSRDLFKSRTSKTGILADDRGSWVAQGETEAWKCPIKVHIRAEFGKKLHTSTTTELLLLLKFKPF